MKILDLIDKYLKEGKLSQADIELLKARGKVPKDFKGFTTQRSGGKEDMGKSPGTSKPPKEDLRQNELAKVGDIFYNSWGYDQTNIDWYQVVQVSPTGKTVKVRPIAGKMKETGFMSGETVPIKGKFTGPAQQRKIYSYSGRVYLTSKYGATPMWDGKPKHASWYA